MHTSLVNKENKEELYDEVLRKSIRIFAKIIFLPFDRREMYRNILRTLVNDTNPGSIICSTQQSAGKALFNVLPSTSISHMGQEFSCQHILACCVLVDIDPTKQYNEEDIKFLSYMNSNIKSLLEFLVALAESDYYGSEIDGDHYGKGIKSGLLLNIKFVNRIFTPTKIRDTYDQYGFHYSNQENKDHIRDNIPYQNEIKYLLETFLQVLKRS